jgi:hypothetical protein
MGHIAWELEYQTGESQYAMGKPTNNKNNGDQN